LNISFAIMRIAAKYHKIFINGRKIREIADYDIQEEIIEPVANLKLEEGKEFISVVKKMLGM